MTRKISFRTNGNSQGNTTRLMSPTDLGEQLKPFIFLDRFDTNFNNRPSAPIYPHSGIGIVTLFTNGDVKFDDPEGGTGVLDKGAVEWNLTGKGVLLGQELSAGNSKTAQGFQLWVALPPELEKQKAYSQFLESQSSQSVGAAKVILGEYKNVKSKIENVANINFLLVSLQAQESWSYQPPKKHNVLWMSLTSGELEGEVDAKEGEMIAFEQSNQSITLSASKNGPATFVIGSAIKHPHHLHFGRHSVHTSQTALFKAEKHISLLKDLKNVPVYRPVNRVAIPVYHGYS